MACNCITHYLEEQKIAAIPYAGVTAKELALLRSSEPLRAEEAEAFRSGPVAADRMSDAQLRQRIAAAIVALDGAQAVAWTTAYLASGGARQPLDQELALTACRLGNDPHNQELAQCLLEDYGKNRGFDRDRLLLACVQHTAVHRKYGDFLECSRRYGRAMGVAALA